MTIALEQTPKMTFDEACALPVDDLARLVSELNAQYRRGHPVVSDAVYDSVFVAALTDKQPGHPLLENPEPEPEGVFGEKIRHSTPMRSIAKCYEDSEVARFVERVVAAAAEIGMERADVFVSCTAKIDGIACRATPDGRYATRGDGVFGQDISSCIERGLVTIGRSGEGDGEVTVPTKYFDEVLAPLGVAHPRNFISGAVATKTPKEHVKQAYADGMIQFVRYDSLPTQCVHIDALESQWGVMLDAARNIDYYTDGAVVRVADESLFNHMGANSHSSRAMIALKKSGECADTTVLDVEWATGRQGSITPVLIIDEVNLSGANINRVTAHNAGTVRALGLSPSARLTVVRAGEIIPTISRVIERCDDDIVPHACPSCNGTALEWENDVLRCVGADCPAQISRTLEHWFKTIDVRGFGPSVCSTLCDSGITNPLIVCSLSVDDFIQCGISAGIARGLAKAISDRKQEPLRDFLYMGAWGLKDLGRGSSRRILEHYDLSEVTGLSAEQIAEIDGFGQITSQQIVEGIAAIKEDFDLGLEVGLCFEKTQRGAKPAGAESAITNKTIVFTGKTSLPRADMSIEAQALGAKVGSSVTGKTDYLVFGGNLGATKMAAAKAKGVAVISEDEYRALLNESIAA